MAVVCSANTLVVTPATATSGSLAHAPDLFLADLIR